MVFEGAVVVDVPNVVDMSGRNIVIGSYGQLSFLSLVFSFAQ